MSVPQPPPSAGLEITVGGMTCSGCVNSVARAVAGARRRPCRRQPRGRPRPCRGHRQPRRPARRARQGRGTTPPSPDRALNNSRRQSRRSRTPQSAASCRQACQVSTLAGRGDAAQRGGGGGAAEGERVGFVPALVQPVERAGGEGVAGAVGPRDRRRRDAQRRLAQQFSRLRHRDRAGREMRRDQPHVAARRHILHGARAGLRIGAAVALRRDAGERADLDVVDDEDIEMRQAGRAPGRRSAPAPRSPVPCWSETRRRVRRAASPPSRSAHRPRARPCARGCRAGRDGRCGLILSRSRTRSGVSSAAVPSKYKCVRRPLRCEPKASVYCVGASAVSRNWLRSIPAASASASRKCPSASSPTTPMVATGMVGSRWRISTAKLHAEPPPRCSTARMRTSPSSPGQVFDELVAIDAPRPAGDEAPRAARHGSARRGCREHALGDRQIVVERHARA